MSAKEPIFGDAARRRFLAGVDTLADAVKVTLGPCGRNVLIDQPGRGPLLANSGVVVARNIELPDPLANAGARMVRTVAAHTSEDAGDGTTTATVLAQSIVHAGLTRVAAGMNPIDLKRGIDTAVVRVTEALRALAVPCDTHDRRAQIATVSASNDHAIGAVIAEALDRVGPDGAVGIEDGSGRDVTLEVVEGLRIGQGFLSPWFVTDQTLHMAVLEDAFVLVCDGKVSALEPMLPVLEIAASASRPLLIVAEDVDGAALTALVVNRMQGTLAACAIKAPGFGDERIAWLDDIAAMTGATVVTERTGLRLQDCGREVLGHATRIEVKADETIVIGGSANAGLVASRVAALRSAAAETAARTDRDRIEHRIARLCGGVALLKVGADTETEQKERKVRIEDALNATRAAMAEGMVPGGGVALLRARSALDGVSGANLDQSEGIAIVRQALDGPLRQLADNFGADPSVAVAKVAAGSGAFGFNGATGDYGDLMAMGVIDPVKVTRLALRNAASVAGLILTMECIVAEE